MKLINFFSKFKKITPKASIFPGAKVFNNELIFKKIKKKFFDNKNIYLLYFDLANFNYYEEEYGSNFCKRILEIYEQIVTEVISHYISEQDLIGIVNMGGDDLVVYFVNPIDFDDEDAFELISYIKSAVTVQLNDRLNSLIKKKLDLHLGFSKIKSNSKYSLESQVYNGVKDAISIAKQDLDLETIKLKNELENIIIQKKIKCVYQPIVSLFSGKILGFEALSRGPNNSFYANPSNLFSYADKYKMLYQLEKVAREVAIENFPEYDKNEKLFLNIEPQILNAVTFSEGFTKKLLDKFNLSPRNIVFEITERRSIEDFKVFRKALEHYRKQGFLIAIDDAGAGYSSLQSIAELKPDYIKIDMSLTKDIHNSHIKKALIETFVTFSKKINATLIAEGIEKEEELKELINLGVTCGQGYYLAKPAFPPPIPGKNVAKKINKYYSSLGKEKVYTNIASICQKFKTVEKEVLTEEIIEYFESNKNDTSIIVVDNSQPVGLIMREHLYYKLGKQYGVSLYQKRKVTIIMDMTPLVVEADLTLDNTLKLALKRNNSNLYDDIIVIKEGKYLGVVSVKKLLETINQYRVKNALSANPLTGLPGNIEIEKELKLRISNKEEFALIVIDLDNFKAYNDKYGFEKGDQVIKMAAKILEMAVKQYGTNTDFVGHIGGDDYTIITKLKNTDNICKCIIKNFDNSILKYYSAQDISNKFIISSDRQGNKNKFPIISISMAVVENTNNINNYLELSEISAELKSYAKSRKGSIYVKDRRN